MLMRYFVVAAFALTILTAAQAMPLAGCNGQGPSGQPNNYPIFTTPPVLIKSVPNGRLYSVGSGVDAVPIVHLWGTPYQKGYAHGLLMKDQATALVNQIYKWIDDKVSAAINGSIGPFPYDIAKWIADTGLDAALDIMSAFTQKYTGSYYMEEMHGMAASAGVSVDRIRRIHMLGELTKGRCSMFGAWGNAIADKTGLLTLRALDWVMDGPFRLWPEITVYHAQNDRENTFLNLGWSGWIGSITGVNDKKLSIHEIGVFFNDSSYGGETFDGIPFVYILRDILQFDSSRLAAVKRMQTSNRTCHLILGVGDGKEKRFNGVQYGRDVAYAMDDTNLKPEADWHPKIENVVYFGMDWLCPGYDRVMARQLQKYHGNLTAALAIQDVMSIVETGDLHVYVADLASDVFYFSVAGRDGTTYPQKAYQRPYTRLDLKALWNVTAPTADEFDTIDTIHVI